MDLNEHARQQSAAISGSTYVLPKTMGEEERMDFQNYYFQLLFKELVQNGKATHRLYAAPLPPRLSFSALDVGCGTNAWAHEMAKEYPQSTVTGVDLTPASKTDYIKPINYRFFQADILHGLPFPPAFFTFVHQRLLVAGIPAISWPMLLGELYRVTMPNGFVEILEASDRYTNVGPQMRMLLKWSKQLSAQYGLDASLVFELETMLRNTGFRDVVQQELRVPLGSWKENDRTGALLATDMHSAFLAMRERYLALSISPEEYDATLAGLIDEWNQYKTEYSFVLAYGQR